MQFFVNGMPMGPGMGPGMPGMGPGMPGMGGMSAKQNVVITELDHDAAPRTSRQPGVVPAQDWSLDNVALIDPQMINNFIFGVLTAGLGSSVVTRTSRTSIRVKPATKPADLTIKVRVKFTNIELQLVQQDTQTQNVVCTVDTLPPGQTWKDWCSNVCRQVIDQSK
jgi:hypothetical protein